MDRTSQIALVLSGGNALGAYHAGAYEQLHQNGIRPDWIVGASIGAVTGAILAGNAPEDIASLNSTSSGPRPWYNPGSLGRWGARHGQWFGSA